MPALEQDVLEVSTKIETELAPNLRAIRTSYAELADKRAEVREALGIYQNLKDLEDRRTALELEEKDGPGNTADANLPASSLDKFSVEVQKILQNWHFPNADRVFFDQKTRDLVINGKNRTSFGKGLRAITQSAFTIGLLEYCKQQGTPHPGFALLNSPLLSYKEPDGADDDLRHTDLKMRFYDYLKQISDDQQVIDGAAMSPTHTRKGGRLYRYYISQSVMKRGTEACQVKQVPSAEIERIVIDQIRSLLRTPEIAVQTWRAARKMDKDLTESHVRVALLEFEPLWNELFPAEQTRIVELLVDRIDLQPDGLDLRLRVAGLTSLCSELRGAAGAHQAAA